MKYSVNSRLSDKIEAIKDSPINGVGTFAREQISGGEIVFVKGGYILTRDQMYTDSKIDSYWPLSDEFVLAAKEKKDVDRIKLYINHSCEPNCGIRGDIVGIAMRNIEVGEEITFDYALLDNEDNRFRCTCGSKHCRHIITGYDWEIKALQEKYKNYFVAYLKDKIKSGFFYQSDNDINSAVKALRKAVFVDELNFSLQEEFASSESHFIHCSLYMKNEIISYARVRIENEKALIDRIATRKDARGKGFGKHIIFWAETEALKRNINRIELLATENVVGFFEQLGYNKVGNSFDENQRVCYRMVKILE